MRAATGAPPGNCARLSYSRGAHKRRTYRGGPICALRSDPDARLPEVETTRRGIAPHVCGRRVTRIDVYDSRLRWPVPADVDARTRGAHDHVDVVLDDGTLLRYRDPRRFGAMLFAHDDRAQRLLAVLGPEPFDAAFDAHYLWRATRARSAPIKLALMDNSLVCGVGNIYANEALFRAGIRPGVRANRLSRARLSRLVEAVREVLALAIAKGGSTLRDYVGSDGSAGYFQLEYFVYGRAGEACRICGTPIRLARLGGRASYHCPRCQR